MPPPREVDLRSGERLEHPVEDRVGRLPLGERLVGEHEPVAEHVLRELAHVLRDDVPPAADQRERACREDEVDRPARAGTVRHVRLQVAEAVLLGRARRVRDPDRVAHDDGVDVDALRPAAAQRVEVEHGLELRLGNQRALEHGQLVLAATG